MKINERNFIAQLRKKNEKALYFIIDNYGSLIHYIVSKNLFLLKDYQGECINDILLAVWEHAHQFDENRSSFRQWITGVAKYKSIDYKRKYLKDLSQSSIEDTNLIYHDEGLASILEEELSEEMEELIECLKPEDQVIFRKLYIEEKDIDEVSAEMGIKPSVLYNRISRGKRKLRNVALEQRSE